MQIWMFSAYRWELSAHMLEMKPWGVYIVRREDSKKGILRNTNVEITGSGRGSISTKSLKKRGQSLPQIINSGINHE